MLQYTVSEKVEITKGELITIKNLVDAKLWEERQDINKNSWPAQELAKLLEKLEKILK
jgi:hypothetical protein